MIDTTFAKLSRERVQRAICGPSRGQGWCLNLRCNQVAAPPQSFRVARSAKSWVRRRTPLRSGRVDADDPDLGPDAGGGSTRRVDDRDAPPGEALAGEGRFGIGGAD